MKIFEELAMEVIKDLEIRGKFSRKNKTDEEMQELITFLANGIEVIDKLMGENKMKFDSLDK